MTDDTKAETMPTPSTRRPLIFRILLGPVVALALCAFSAASQAAPFDDAVAALSAGDYERALALFQPLAADGNASAQYYVGVMFENGYSTTRNEVAALTWYRLSAEQGVPQAAYNIGMMTIEGRGVPPDPVTGAQWVLRAGEQGYPLAQHTLGYFYLDGTGVPVDLAEAHRWFTAAAESGVVDAQFNLGYLYETGTGVPIDAVAAYRWYAIAATLGDQGAARAANDVGTLLTEEQRTNAQNEAAAWLEAHGL